MSTRLEKKSLCASRWRGKREIGYNFWRTITHVCIVQYISYIYICFAWIVNLLISHFLWLYLCHKFLLDALATQKPNSSTTKKKPIEITTWDEWDSTYKRIESESSFLNMRINYKQCRIYIGMKRKALASDKGWTTFKK